MVQAEVHLVEGQRLLEVARVDRAEVLIQVAVVDLETGKLRVLNTDVNADHSQSDDVRFEGLQGTRNSQLVIGVAIQNIDKLLLLDCANHDGATFRVSSQILARYDPANSGLAESLLVDLDEAVRVVVKLKNNDSAGVGADDHEVLLHSHETEGNNVSDQAEYFLTVNQLDLTCDLVDFQELKDFAFCNHKLLLVGFGKASIDGLRDGRSLVTRC
mmetsp:Transcript_36615/g.44736  ORF Transcript_36615/g.44736 Transcript_36615/m.44736 type:complete len:215 (-) Transcript_36615:25-669(-)